MGCWRDGGVGWVAWCLCGCAEGGHPRPQRGNAGDPHWLAPPDERELEEKAWIAGLIKYCCVCACPIEFEFETVNLFTEPRSDPKVSAAPNEPGQLSKPLTRLYWPHIHLETARVLTTARLWLISMRLTLFKFIQSWDVNVLICSQIHDAIHTSRFFSSPYDRSV